MVMLVPDDFSESSLSSVITTRQGKGYVPYVTQAGGPGLGVLVSQGWFVLPTTPPKLPTSGVKSSGEFSLFSSITYDASHVV